MVWEKKMATGRSNKITQQVGEFLVSAELGKQGLIATPFAGNVPKFDIIVADEYCRTLPIQVKASNSDSWKSTATEWMKINYNEKTEQQEYLSPLEIDNPELIYVFVRISQDKKENDRFFILKKKDYQNICIECYSAWMNAKNWKRPKSPKSYDCRPTIRELVKFEDNWDIIKESLGKIKKTVN